MDVDLEPHNWKSERDKPKEPIFGPGLPSGLAWLISFIVVASISYYFRH